MDVLPESLRLLHSQPDSRLVELARAGEERAFEALVQRYRCSLLAYCRQITTSETNAEDVLQQALLQAWMALFPRSVEVRDPRAWLYRIAHNVAVSSMRGAVPETFAVAEPPGGSGADDEVERRLAVRDALASIASLPEPQRQVMLSTALEGRSHEEVAQALGLSHDAVRGLIYRARSALRAAAASVTPAPLLHWALRQQGVIVSRWTGPCEGVVNGGNASLGGLLMKSGAIVASAGVIAAAAGVTHTPVHQALRHHAVGSVKLASGRSTSADRRRAGAGVSGGGLSSTAVATALVSAGTSVNGLASENHGGKRPDPSRASSSTFRQSHGRDVRTGDAGGPRPRAVHGRGSDSAGSDSVHGAGAASRAGSDPWPWRGSSSAARSDGGSETRPGSISESHVGSGQYTDGTDRGPLVASAGDAQAGRTTSSVFGQHEPRGGSGTGAVSHGGATGSEPGGGVGARTPADPTSVIPSSDGSGGGSSDGSVERAAAGHRAG
jgi:RNA polymerase sigma factor (sigma-70 family)